MPRTRNALLSLLFLPLAVACGGDGGTGPVAATVAQIVVTPATLTLTSVGATQQLSASALDAVGNPVAGAAVSWRSSTPSVVTVTTGGLVTATGSGTATVFAEAGGKSGQASVLVEVQPCAESLPVALAPGEVLVTDPTAAGGCPLLLPSGASGDRYRVGVVRTSGAASGSTDTVTLTLTGLGVATSPPALGAAPPPPVFGLAESALMEASARMAGATGNAHLRLREAEDRLLRRFGGERVPAGVRAPGAPLPAAPAKRTFLPRAPTDASCVAPSDTVTALRVLESAEIVVYQDSAQAQSDPIGQAEVQELLDFYSAWGKSTIADYFGTVPDRDGNGKVLVLATPRVGSQVAAFVWGGDLLSAGVGGCPASNEAELVYFNAGLINQIGSGNYQALETLVHEVKHVVSFYERLSGNSFGLAPSWMEEGAAEIAGEVASRRAWAAAGGPAPNARVTASAFAKSGPAFTRENYGVALRLFRAGKYLSTQPNAVTYAPAGGAYSVYGSGWHFHRFLGDAYGGAAAAPGADGSFFRQQTSSATPPGLSGLPLLTGAPYDALVVEMAAAVMLNGTGAPEPARGFTTYDLPSATDIFASGLPDVPYPYPVTASGPEPSASFASGAWTGPIGNGGLRIHDFKSNGTGVGAEVRVDVDDWSAPVKVVVVRLR